MLSFLGDALFSSFFLPPANGFPAGLGGSSSARSDS
jgi:hypothetical protein